MSSKYAVVLYVRHRPKKINQRHRRHIAQERATQNSTRFFLGRYALSSGLGAKFTKDYAVQLSDKNLRHFR